MKPNYPPATLSEFPSHRAMDEARNFTEAGAAPSSLTSGFGSVMEQEHALQSATAGCLGARGPNAHALTGIFRTQQMQLDANIALLEQRYDTLPHPARFDALHGRLRPLTRARRVAVEPEQNEGDMLHQLVGEHLNLLANIEALIARGTPGTPGDFILTEVARNHEEMAWMLTALLKENVVRDLVTPPIIAQARPESRWENEGGNMGDRTSSTNL